MLGVSSFAVMLTVIRLSVAFQYCYADCLFAYAECRYAECHYANCRGANPECCQDNLSTNSQKILLIYLNSKI
jgi:hypothetical protein